jgi:hypothetical protein
LYFLPVWLTAVQHVVVIGIAGLLAAELNPGDDCYLPSLAKKLGYKLPPNGKTQREFWEAVSRRAIYHRELEPSEWPRADATDNGGGKRINNEKNDENESHDAGDGSEEGD